MYEAALSYKSSMQKHPVPLSRLKVIIKSKIHVDLFRYKIYYKIPYIFNQRCENHE